MNKRILITGVGGDIGQSVIKCLKDIDGSFNLVGCDIDSFAAGRKLVDRFYIAPQVKDDSEYISFIERILKEDKVTHVFPVTEWEIEFFNNQRGFFNERANIFINKQEIVETFLDKYETINFLKKNNLPYPKTYLVDDYKDELSFPFILKPRKGCGGKGFVFINNREDLNFFGRKMRDGVIQEIIGSDDDEYTAAVFSTGKDYYTVAFKRILGYGSLTKVARLSDDERIKLLAENIAKAVSLEGSLNIQCRKTQSGYVPFEINPRLSSTVYLRHFFGFQDVRWWLDFKEGRGVEYMPKFRQGVAIRTIGEIFVELV
ncbi:MAG: ATP-grasp domain-containing protein [Candidatus Omnitrophota bacterium]|nr:ATP-grasp domain-containing protein [Candidatus Omnitrophota bacterium]